MLNTIQIEVLNWVDLALELCTRPQVLSLPKVGEKSMVVCCVSAVRTNFFFQDVER